MGTMSINKKVKASNEGGRVNELNSLQSFIKEIKKNSQLFLLTLPGLIFVIIFSYVPMMGIIVAFKSYNFRKGILGSPWAGFENFKFFFTSESAYIVTKNTIVLNGIMIILSTVFAVSLALILDNIKGKLFKKISQSIIMFPHFISWAIVGYFTYGLFEYNFGFLNSIVKALGMAPISWYDSPQYWPTILVSASLWKGIGYSSIVYLAAIAGISQDYYEAAEIDGATPFQLVTKITLPNIAPLISIMVLLAIGGIFRADFGLFYTLTRQVPTLFNATDVIDTFVFRALRQNNDIGMASAAGLYQSVVGFIFIICSNLYVRRKNPDNSLF